MILYLTCLSKNKHLILSSFQSRLSQTEHLGFLEGLAVSGPLVAVDCAQHVILQPCGCPKAIGFTGSPVLTLTFHFTCLFQRGKPFIQEVDCPVPFILVRSARSILSAFPPAQSYLTDLSRKESTFLLSLCHPQFL
jgi:hypothetical protein